MKPNKFMVPAADVRLALRYRMPALIILIVLSVILGFGLTRLKLATDPLTSMYPEGHSYISTLTAIKAMAPEPRMLVCLIKVNQGDIYTIETINKIDALTNGLMEIEGIMPGGIISLTKGMNSLNNTATEGLKIESIMGVWPQNAEEFEELKRRVAVNAMGLGRFVSYDQSAVMITAKLADINQLAQAAYDELPEKGRPTFEKFKAKEDAKFNANLVKQIEALKAKQDDAKHTLFFMGGEVMAAQMMQMGTTHIGGACGVMFVLIIMLLIAFFRSLSGVVGPLVAMIVTLVWTLGIYGLSGLELNPLMIPFPLILGLIALAAGAMLMQAFKSSDDKAAAIVEAVQRSGVRGLILTAGLVMGGMCLVSVPVVRALGFLGLSWIVGAYAGVVLFQPILMDLLPAPTENAGTSAAQAVPSAGLRYAGLAIGLVFIVVGGLMYSRLVYGDNVPGTSYIKANHPWNQCFNLLAEKFMGPYQLVVYVKAKKPGGLMEPEALGAISDFSSYLVNECGARDCIAVDFMVKMARASLMDGNPKWLVLPLIRQQNERMMGNVFEQGGVEDFIDRSNTQATIQPFFPKCDTQSIDAYAAKMQAYIDRNPSDLLEFKLGGGLLGMTKPLNDATRLAYPRVLGFGFVILFSVASLVLMSPRKGFGITLAALAAQGIVWLGMTFLGMSVSLPVASVSAATIGAAMITGMSLFKAEGGWSRLAPSIVVVAACLPWAFIGMRFQMIMMMTFGALVLAQIIAGLLMVPAFASGKKS